MGITATKHTVVMHFPSLIKRSCVSTDALTSHPDATVGRKNEMAFVGFKELNLSELSALDFSTQKLHDWVTHACISATIECHTDTTPLPTMIAPNAKCTEESSHQTWTLVRHVPLFPFWGRDSIIHNIRHDNSTLMEHMKSYHCLAARWLQIMGDCVACRTTLLLAFRQGLQQEGAALTRSFCNGKYFDNLCNTESPYASFCSFLLVPT